MRDRGMDHPRPAQQSHRTQHVISRVCLRVEYYFWARTTADGDKSAGADVQAGPQERGREARSGVDALGRPGARPPAGAAGQPMEPDFAADSRPQ